MPYTDPENRKQASRESMARLRKERKASAILAHLLASDHQEDIFVINRVGKDAVLVKAIGFAPIPVDPKVAEYAEIRQGLRDAVTAAMGAPTLNLGVNTNKRHETPPAGAGVNSYSKAQQTKGRGK